MHGTFALTVTLGNDAMNDPEHLADALRDLAERIEGSAILPRDDGRVYDVNGNPVGIWAIRPL